MAITSEEEVIKTVAEGTTEGVLNWSKKEIVSAVKKIRAGELAFIGDED